jgi:hypothetical protein
MTCYRISQGDEAIVILTSLGMAQAITRCQPPGYYRVDEIDVNSPIVERQPPAWRQRIRHSDILRSHEPGGRSGRKIFLRLEGCPATACAIVPERPEACREHSEGIPTANLSTCARPLALRRLSS